VNGRPRTASRLRDRGVEILPVKSPTPLLSVKQVLRELYRRNVGSILVEGGAHVFSQFVYQRLFDELQIFIAPGFIGRGISALAPEELRQLPLRILPHHMEVRKVGNDALLSMFVE
jgi:diaminohydroxyphosphoribosylaminopyrimidine deaminase/5-amino-6-(5-phosphoribosylamino)uracil reductase